MFAYILSACIVFVIFGSALNIYCKVKGVDYNKDDSSWLILLILSTIYPITIVCVTVLLIVFVLKLLTDKVIEIIIDHNKHKHK